jgi:hypothetical protein
MKYIKKFEGRKVKSTNPQTEDQILSDYKDKCDDLDDRSYITFDEFFEGLDFDIFSKHDYNKFSESGVYASRISGGKTSRWQDSYGGRFEVNIKGQRYNFFTSEYGRFCPTGLENSLDWKKRNVFFYAEVNTGGASGGSCWDTGDDDGAQPYEGSSLDLNDFIFSYLKPIIDNILSSHANEKSAQDLCQILYNNPSIIKEDSRCNHEYYGNYDDFSCYYITLGDLYQFLSENNSF